MQYNNPIVSGFNPDPSICRVGDDYYLVTSTFEFFPGVPVYHSKNLINWELINYCLTDDIQLPLEMAPDSWGIMAATIRWHDGTFFMTTTISPGGGNFIVHTNDIRGKWSKPVFVKQRGIDASLFWDDDGTCYFVSNGSASGEGYGLFACKIDPFTGEMLSDSYNICEGGGGKYPEGPHIYKRDGWYYLMVAEGGTGYGHMETIFRSRNVFGPYEGAPKNPILTHRDGTQDMRSLIIDGTGHADLVEDQNGNWWMVCLAFRRASFLQFLHNLGRETFLTPVVWGEDGWPVVGDNGRISLLMDGPLPGPAPTPVNMDFVDNFDGDALDLHWNFVRNPKRERYVLKDSCLTLKGKEEGLSEELGRPTMVIVRQPGFGVTAEAKMQGIIESGQKSGLVVYHNHMAHYEIYVTKEEDKYFVCLGKQVYDINAVTAKNEIAYPDDIRLKVVADREWYVFYYELDGTWIELGRGVIAPMCAETAINCSYNGTLIGLFSQNGEISFDKFSMLTKEI